MTSCCGLPAVVRQQYVAVQTKALQANKAVTCVKVRNSATNASLKLPLETRASISSVATRSSGPAFLCSLFCTAQQA